MSDPGVVFGNPSPQPNPDRSSTPDAAKDHLNLDQMMSLVDSILPFEACLYYQVIPLSIEANHLNLGMVNLDDTAATDYVRRQVAYINYSLSSWPISSDWHREMLSKFLSHKAKTKPTPQGSTHPSPASPSPQFSVDQADQATYIVDSPPVLPGVEDKAFPAPDNSAKAFRASPNSDNSAKTNSTQASDHLPVPEENHSGHSRVQVPSVNPSRQGNLTQPLSLNIPPHERSKNLANISSLPPKQLSQALLSRVLQNGIGRLYFERGETAGKILWSKDGVVQAALENLPLPLFQSVINEFKRLTHLSLLPTKEARQVEIERTYRQERVVLRFRLIAGPHGEEATLQVLRGAALKFYQQKQIDQLGRDALSFAHRLQRQIDQIREHSRQTLTLKETSASTLNTISHLLKDIDDEISELIHPPH